MLSHSCYPVQSQYKYIHDALTEYITCGDTSFPLMDARKLVKELSESLDGKTGFEKQFEVSND